VRCEKRFIVEYLSRPKVHVIEGANVEKAKVFMWGDIREQRESMAKATALDQRLWIGVICALPALLSS